MEDGAFGVATALIYPPGAYSSTAELTATMEVVAAYHGVHITHMRNEGIQILEALEETIQIAQDSGVITEIYHLKATGSPSWPKMPAVIDRINEARAGGLDIAAVSLPRFWHQSGRQWRCSRLGERGWSASGQYRRSSHPPEDGR